MSSPERFKDLSARYIASIEDTEGNLDFTGHRAAEVVDEILKGKPGYIGVVPIGSLMRGYSNDESDIDLFVLLDSPHIEREFYARVLSDSIAKKVKESGVKKDVHCLPVHVSQEVIRNGLTPSRAPYEFWFQIFNSAAIGENIDTYRRMTEQHVKSFQNLDDQKTLIRGMANAIADQEMMSIGKIQERALKDAATRQEFFNLRIKLWEQQIKRGLHVEY